MDNVRINKSSRQRLWLNVLLCIFAICRSGLRDINKLPLNNDTPNYLTRFNDALNNSWLYYIKQFAYFNSGYEDRDQGWPIFIKFTQLFTDDFTVFMFIVAAVFIIPLGWLIYKYVHNTVGTLLAYLIYFSLFTNITDSFMRQAVAMGVIFYGVRYIMGRDWLRYYLLLIIAYTLHASALLAIPLYFIPYIKKLKYFIVLLVLLIPLVMLYTREIAIYLMSGSVYENYALSNDDYAGPVVFMLLLFMVDVIVIYNYNNIKNVEHGNLLITGVAMATFLTPMAWITPTILRITYYYSIFIVPLIPVCIESMRVGISYKRMAYAASFAALTYLMMK